ncbi:hypothetical protein DENSPDRAFT_828456 [Dentipellis sp. KUC8613]|nr:hypothetical protein DENSPDRAFT_828456 [Dentipellis sp. KUC8613]
MSIPIRGRTLGDDEADWEDVDNAHESASDIFEFEKQPPSASPSVESFQSTNASRKRRVAKQRTTTTVITARKPQSNVRRIAVAQRPYVIPETSQANEVNEPPRRPPVGPSNEEIQEALFNGVFHTTRYVLDVFRIAVRFLKMPIAMFLFFWLLALILSRMSAAIRNTLSPLCIVPGISRLCALPAAPVAEGPQWADYPQLMNVQSQTLETLLEEAVDGPGLALEIKQAEMATSDLATLVRVSELTSRDRLAEALTDFVSDSRKVGRGLHQFSSKVGGAVDNIMAVNDYALHAIEAANSKSSALSLRKLWPFAPDEAATAQIVTKTFSDAMDTLSVNMERLILEAEVSLSNLEKLEQRLSTIHELVAREDKTLSTAKEDLLASLWTILGGNRRELKRFEHHLSLLANVGGYRERALAHVVAALQTLQGMSSDMEELRARVAAPELVGTHIPVEVHMRSIRAGLDRLQDRRVRAQQREEDITDRVVRRNGERNIGAS